MLQESTRGTKWLLTPMLLVLGIGIIIDACRKMDHIREKEKPTIDQTVRFFTMPANTDLKVRAIAEKIKRQNDQYHFVNELVSRVGLPVWNKSIVTPSNPSRNTGKINTEDSVLDYVYIPFADSSVNAILIAGMTENDTMFRMINDYEYKQFDTISTGTTWTQKNVFTAFTYFEKQIFNQNSFVIDDKHLIPLEDTTKTAVVTIQDIGQQRQSKTALYEYVEVCATYHVCIIAYQPANAFQVNCDGVCDQNCQYWHHDYQDCVSFWYGGSNWSGNQPPFIPYGYNTGGGVYQGGGNGPWWPDVCHGNTECTTPGWHKQLPPDEVPYSPGIYDTVRYDNGFKSVFPCIYSFIKDSLENLNRLAQIAGMNVFNDSAYVNITMDTSTIYTSPDSISAHTKTSNITIGNDGITHFSATIFLNPWHLRHATMEYIISTIIHEAMHAIFTLRWGQYLNWRQYHNTKYDSAWIRDKFPTYWYAIQNQAVELTALQEHEIMAADYLHKYDSLMRLFWNPAASSAERDTVIKAMGWSGLTQTTAWKALPSHGVDTCKYKAIQLASQKAEMLGANEYPIGCNDSIYHKSFDNDLKLRSSCMH